MIRLTHDPIDYHALTESVRSPHCGAVALFLGTVRDLTGQHTSLTDIPLTAAGEAAAKMIGARLAGISFARVFSSPLQRARRTAELAGFAPEIDPELVEWNYGDCEGRKTVDIRKTVPGWD